MPYPSTRYRDMTPKMEAAFKESFLKQLDEAVRDLNPDLILCHHLYLLTAIVREHFPDRKVFGFYRFAADAEDRFGTGVHYGADSKT